MNPEITYSMIEQMEAVIYPLLETIPSFIILQLTERVINKNAEKDCVKIFILRLYNKISHRLEPLIKTIFENIIKEQIENTHSNLDDNEIKERLKLSI